MPPVVAVVRGAKLVKKALNASKKIDTDIDSARGIQNATSRFRQQREGQLLSTQLMEEAGKKRFERESANDSEYAANDPMYDTPNQNRSQEIGEQTQYLENELQRLKNTEGFDYGEGDVEKFIANPPQKPVFPIIMLSVGVIKDIIDLGTITGIGMLVTIPVSFLMSLILFIYFLGKMGGIQRWLWKRYIFATIISFTPLNVLPETTLLVFLAYHHENKIVKGITEALERMRSGGMRGD